jgi:penicillin G amidase
MRKKWLWIILIILLVLILAAGAVAYWIARGGLPKTSGTIVTGVNEPVEIYRDQYGVPHIIATSMEDLVFAQGYAQAQDRMWQMDMSRRGVSGRLSEILGADFVETDYFTLTVGFLRAAEKNYDLLSPETKILLEAYADGVNAYIDDNVKRLPPEFTLLGYKPEPWTTMDSLAIGVYMSWYLGGNMQSELFHAALVEEVGVDLAVELFPDYPEYGPIIAPTVTDGLTLDEDDVAKLLDLSRIAELNGKTKFVPGLGSNNWVIGGELTEGRGAILANDMHLGMGLPSIWHNIHLILKDEMNITGVMFPGIPGVIVGFNEHIAWGVTNTGPDVQDLFLLELNPENPQQYRYMDQWLEADIFSAEIRIKGEEEPLVIEVAETRFGPVVSGVVGLDIPMSLRWTALDGTREFDAIIGLMRAANWDEFLANLENFMAPTQNFVYADREGNIGYRANGLIPIRRSGEGLLPADGRSDLNEWVGFIPFVELPTVYNPPEGIIVTANHRVVDEDYPYFISYQWAPPYRAMSIWTELEKSETYNLEDMIRGQTSFLNTQAFTLQKVLSDALLAADLEQTEAKAVEIFIAWLGNPYEEPDAVGPTIYNVLYYKMMELTFLDEMGEEMYERFLHNRGNANAFDRMLLSNESGWFNNVATETIEERDDIIVLAFKETVAFLSEEIGPDPESWNWGKLHTITLKHNLGSVDALARIYNRGPYPVGGSFHTPANMSYQLTDPYGVTHSAPWRYMVNMDNYEALDVLAGGISGHPLSKHYNDQTEMWLAGEYKQMVFSIEEVQALPKRLLLEPQ